MENKKNHIEKNNKEEIKLEEELKECKTVSVSDAEFQKLKEDAVKAEVNWDKLLRLQADFDNYRKRTERERQEFSKYANEEIIVELLNVLDDLERAVNLTETKHQDLPAFLKGIEMILAHLYDLLKEKGVSPIQAEGKAFDPNLHEALMQAENNDLPEHTVMEELQKGYLLNERVIRTSKVKVSKRGPQSTDGCSQ